VEITDDEVERLRQLLDKQEITEVLLRRRRAGDHGDAAGALACYHEMATEDHGAFKGLAEDFVVRVAEASLRDPSRRSMWNAVCDIHIQLHGDRALVESYVIMCVELLEEGQLMDLRNGLRHLDTFERRSGRWAIVHRDVVYDWSRKTPTTHHIWDDREEDAFLRGRRDLDDPLYARLIGRR